MKDILEIYRKDLIEYCKENGLLYEKILLSPMCGNERILFVQHIDSNKAKLGLLDETPAEVLLQIEKNGNGFTYTPGQNMNKYLA